MLLLASRLADFYFNFVSFFEKGRVGRSHIFKEIFGSIGIINRRNKLIIKMKEVIFSHIFLVHVWEIETR